MAKFLDTTGISNELAQIIKGAKARLILISPYLKVCERFKEMLEDQDRMKLDIRLIYRKSELPPQESNWLKSLNSVRTSICKNLHAKCYINENKALITSMNFYEFSQINNNEMGIVVNKEEDLELYNEIFSEAQRLIRISDETKVTGEKVVPKKESIKNFKTKKMGHCIRCNTDITLDTEHPLCKKCYSSWKRYSDQTYKEKFCHICGKKTKSSMKKPVCYSCYIKNK